MIKISHIRDHCLLLIICILCSGCLPSSCRRIEPQTISPSDSLSRSIASSIVADTLSEPLILGLSSLKYPRTVLYGQSNHLFVSDTKTGDILIFAFNGETEHSFRVQGINFPYLAGWHSDTLIVFDPETHQFHSVIDSLSVDSVTITNVPQNSLQYALAHNSHLYHKAVTRDSIHLLRRFDRSGTLTHELTLHGSSWKHAGLLRSVENRLISLSGFYPQALSWTLDLSLKPDTLRWKGFDSPMLKRTYAFDQGHGRGAPLITSSATWTGDYWFVLNQRAGWLRVDIYNSDGMLKYILTEHSPTYLRNFYPIDLAVKYIQDGSYQIAVAILAPQPSIHVYHWTPTHSI
ncbi:MAG: hypothetical protein OXE59_09555 [Bacteroidetes bacterium]|nr:hypothetical protein [Bacteroidota bacterium]